MPEVSVQSVTLVDSAGNGDVATQVATFVEQLRHTTGIDLGGQVDRWFNDQSQAQKKTLKKR